MATSMLAKPRHESQTRDDLPAVQGTDQVGQLIAKCGVWAHANASSATSTEANGPPPTTGRHSQQEDRPMIVLDPRTWT